jgi:ABC-type sugar transport system permease subunit
MLAGLLTPLIVALTVQVMVFLLGLVSILYVMVGGEPTDSTGES